MAALAGLVAHGGVYGAVAEGFVALAVTAVFVAIWVRERRVRREQAHDGPAVLTDRDDDPV